MGILIDKQENQRVRLIHQLMIMETNIFWQLMVALLTKILKNLLQDFSKELETLKKVWETIIKKIRI
jgi:hypothetical protein